MPEIKQIDVQVFPDYAGGTYMGSAYVDKTGEVRYFNTHASQSLVKQWRAQRQYERVGHVMDQQRYLFLFCTKKQICEAAARVSSVEEFEDLIGGDFKIWRYTEYYAKEVSTRRHLDF